MTLNRRSLIGVGAAGLMAGVVAARPGSALAHAPQMGKQAQGFYRFKIGSIEVTVVSDGTVGFPAESLWGAPAGDVKALLASEFRPTTPAVLQLNTIVLNTGDKLVLVDTGSGGKFQNTNGALVGNLAAAGYAPGDVDIVLLTHGHPDHLWGASDAANTALMFPAAEIVMSEAEFGFWSAEELPGKVPAGMKPMIETTQAHLKVVNPHVRLIKAGAEVVPGVHTVDTAGHTPGHMSVQVASGNEELIVTGDVISHPTVSFRRPEWTLGFDMDPVMGAKTRSAFLDRTATDKTLIASYHLPFPAVGHVIRDGDAYRWVPAEWRWSL
jgi:glyoxylase-like metal-dependent hydrolase (beta-lactamase superfamily II)